MSLRARVIRVIQESSLYVLLMLLPFSKAACEIIFGVFLIAWLVQRFDPDAKTSTVWLSPALRPMALAIGAYLAVCALSILISDFPRHSVRGFVDKWLEYLLFLVLVTDLVAQPRGGRATMVRRGLHLMAWSSLAVILLGVRQEIFISTRPGQYDSTFVHNRMMGPYQNPGDLATYLMVAIPIFVGLSRGVRGPRPVCLWIVILGVMASLARTESLGAWIGLWVGLLVMVCLDQRIRRIGLVLMIASAVAGWLFLQHTGHAYKLSSPTYAGKVDRVVMWQAAVNMVHDRPLLGHGLNTFMANYLRYWVGGEKTPRYAHNCFLQVTAETGVLGLAAFLWLLGAMGWFWWKAVRSVKDPRDPSRSLLLGLSAGLAAFVVQSSVDTNFYSLRQAVLFWMLAGLATGLALTMLSPPRRLDAVQIR
ncbi:MAG: O-antigen ligase family protein [Candidatus Omnitrophica bacterium]|nr:O-antigen ligase family protein [Candidatus Omnitrophota bacterium]